MEKEILYNGLFNIPATVAICPECQGKLKGECYEWSDNKPVRGGITVYCKNENKLNHKFWQSDWQEIINSIESWLEAIEI